MKEYKSNKRANEFFGSNRVQEYKQFQKWTNDMAIEQVYIIKFQQVQQNYFQNILFDLHLYPIKQYYLKQVKHTQKILENLLAYVVGNFGAPLASFQKSANGHKSCCSFE